MNGPPRPIERDQRSPAQQDRWLKNGLHRIDATSFLSRHLLLGNDVVDCIADGFDLFVV